MSTSRNEVGTLVKRGLYYFGVQVFVTTFSPKMSMVAVLRERLARLSHLWHEAETQSKVAMQSLRSYKYKVVEVHLIINISFDWE